MGEVVQAVLMLAIVTSFVVFGLTKTITNVLRVEKLNPIIMVITVYLSGMLAGKIYWNHENPVTMIVSGLFIGAVSVGIYEAAVKALLNLIPILIERLVGPERKGRCKDEVE